MGVAAFSERAAWGYLVIRLATERDIPLPDGRTVHVYDSGGDGMALLWHHGSPQTGALLAPLLEAAAERGIRLVGYARPSYGGSTPDPGRDVAKAAGDVRVLADALGLGRFATMGASGGGPHALACAALLGDRVTGVVTLASPAPYTEAFDWFAGMVDPGGLRAAPAGPRGAGGARRDRGVRPRQLHRRRLGRARGRLEVARRGRDARRAGRAGRPDRRRRRVRAPWGFDARGRRRRRCWSCRAARTA